MPTRAKLRRVHRKLSSRFSRAAPHSSMNLFLFVSIPPPIFSLSLLFSTNPLHLQLLNYTLPLSLSLSTFSSPISSPFGCRNQSIPRVSLFLFLIKFSISFSLIILFRDKYILASKLPHFLWMALQTTNA
jgi:hypothetical protein